MAGFYFPEFSTPCSFILVRRSSSLKSLNFNPLSHSRWPQRRRASDGDRILLLHLHSFRKLRTVWRDQLSFSSRPFLLLLLRQLRLSLRQRSRLLSNHLRTHRCRDRRPCLVLHQIPQSLSTGAYRAGRDDPGFRQKYVVGRGLLWRKLPSCLSEWMSILVECRTVGPRRFLSSNVFCVFASSQRMTYIMKPTILSLRFGICTSLLSGVISSLSFCGTSTRSSARICATLELGYKVRTSRTGTTRTCTRDNLTDVTNLWQTSNLPPSSLYIDSF